MNRLVAHLNRCLQLHSCVLLPGLGAFATEPIAARYDACANLVYPPYEELRFNAALSHHDGLLEESYSQSYGISQRRARIMLDEDIRLLRAELLHNASIKLDKIGTLSLNEEGRLLFEPSDQNDYASISYGLFPCSLPFLTQSDLLESAVSEHRKEPAIQSQRDSRYLYFRLSKRMTGIAVAFTLAILLSLLPFSNISAPEHFSASFVPSELAATKFWNLLDGGAADLQETGALDSAPAQLLANDEASASTKVQSSSEMASSLPELQEPVGTKAYYVILATFSNKRSALAYCQDNDCLGKSSEAFLLIGKSKVRVAAHHFDNATDAYNYRKDLVKQYPQFRSSWVYEAK